MASKQFFQFGNYFPVNEYFPQNKGRIDENEYNMQKNCSVMSQEKTHEKNYKKKVDYVDCIPIINKC
jgi:hypothetical protein